MPWFRGSEGLMLSGAEADKGDGAGLVAQAKEAGPHYALQYRQCRGVLVGMMRLDLVFRDLFWQQSGLECGEVERHKKAPSRCPRCSAPGSGD